MAEIEVQRIGEEPEQLSFLVHVEEAGERSRHEVSLQREDFERLGVEWGSPEEFVQACFEFLLEREPKESILGRFDVREIGTYFPAFEKEILKPRERPSGERQRRSAAERGRTT